MLNEPPWSPSIVHTATHGWPIHAIHLAATLFRYLDVGGYCPEAVTIHGHARHAAQHRSATAPPKLAALTSLGLANLEQGRFQQATGHLGEALALFRDTSDQAGQARALGNLGLADYQQCRYQSATSYLQQALALYRKMGDMVGEGRQLQNLGVIDERQGRA